MNIFKFFNSKVILVPSFWGDNCFRVIRDLSDCISFLKMRNDSYRTTFWLKKLKFVYSNHIKKNTYNVANGYSSPSTHFIETESIISVWAWLGSKLPVTNGAPLNEAIELVARWGKVEFDASLKISPSNLKNQKLSLFLQL